MIVKILLNTFYSSGDERRFFEGLKENLAVKEARGVGLHLVLNIDLRVLSRDRAYELIALLFRYKVPLKPLHPLANKPNYKWLKDKSSYWYRSMFDK